MKELIRLKTITSKGNVLLSPFVFKEEEAKKRIKSASKTFEKRFKSRCSTELLRVSKYPPDAVWSEKKHGKDKKNIDALVEYIKRLGLRWEVIENAYNRENA